MSIRLMTDAWKLDLRSTVKLVLLALADNASDEGKCYPSVATLRRKCSLSERAIQVAITELEKLGHVTRTPRLNRSTVYTVHPLVKHENAPPQDMHPPPQVLRPEMQDMHRAPAPAAP